MANRRQQQGQKSTKPDSIQEKRVETPQRANSYDTVIKRFNEIASMYGDMSTNSIYAAFTRAGVSFVNEPFTQNARVKAINPLPANYTKEDLGEFLRVPQSNEVPLQQVSETLRWTSYPYQKTVKSYADMLTFRHFAMPQYVDKGDANKDDFLREWRLVDKLEKAFNIRATGMKAAMQALSTGKVFYTLRTNIDRAHNQANYVYAQQLPQGWCRIIGFNNVSEYTISFDMTYFLQPGTDYRQFGDLFEPYINDFASIFEPHDAPKGVGTKYIYATEIKVGDKKYSCDLSRVNRQGAGNPDMFYQNGRWCYYVSLPIERVWTFEIDPSTAIVASPLAGLFQTFAQQADYEAAQLSVVTLPLVKIFTGEIPYNSSEDAKPEDNYKLSIGGRKLFQAYWDILMRSTNTGGTALYSAPLENIKSHDFTAASNANEISSSYLQYGFGKTGLTALIPIDSSPKAGTEQTSGYLEGRYAEKIYRSMENMFNNLLDSLKLRYGWKLHIFGTIYTDNEIRSNALKQLDKGDISQYFVLAALDDMSLLDKLSLSIVTKASGILELLIPPKTAYTISGSTTRTETSDHNSGANANGAPTKDETEIIETKQEKRIEGETED